MVEKTRVPPAKFIKNNLPFSALISKLVENKVKEKAFIDEAGSYNVMTQTASLKAISKDVQESSKNTESIISLFPDMELSMQILISSIISPKDMVGSQLIYKVKNEFLTPEITGKLINIVKDHCENYYKLKEDLPEMLRQILFINGAYSVCIIPESELDVIINSQAELTTESFKSKKIIDKNNNLYGLGYLGLPKENNNLNKSYESLNIRPTNTNIPETPISSLTEERVNLLAENITKQILPNIDIVAEEKEKNKISSLIKDYTLNLNKRILKSLEYVTITDNPDVLKLGELIKYQLVDKSKKLVKSKYKVRYASEDIRGVPDSYDISKLRDALYKSPNSKISPFVSLSLLQPLRKSIGRPLMMKLPTESIIPVHTPGNPNQHIGYFVLVDQHGSPLHMVEKITALTELDEGLMQPDTSMNSILVQRAQDNIRGKNIKGMSIDNALPIYTNLIEQELMARLEAGIYGKNVEISNVNEIYKIMLSRTLKNQMTKLVYMPAEMVEYMRYKIHPNGVGKALSEDLRILLSIRAMMLFSRLMASVKNSIGITEINLKLDERDPDPLKTIEIVKNEILRARQQNFPIGISTPMDLADWVQRSGLEFTFEGHPRIPDIKLEYNQHGASNIMPDESLDEDLRKRTIMSYGLSPETIDNGFSPDFATSVVANNILLSKRVIMIQKTILGHLKNLITKIILADAIIYEELANIVKKNLGTIKELIKAQELKKIPDDTLIEFVVNEFVEVLEIELPLPEVTTITNQMDSFDKYSEFLDKALEAWVNQDMFDESFVGELGSKSQSIKAILKSYYIRKWLVENGVMEELSEIEKDINASNVFEVQKEFLNKLIVSSTKFITGMQEMVKAVGNDFNNYKISSDGGMGDTSSGGDDDFGGLGEDLDETNNDENAVTTDEIQTEIEDKTDEETEGKSEQNEEAENTEEAETPSI